MHVSTPWPAEWAPPPNLDENTRLDGEEYHRALYHDGDPARPRGWHRDNTAKLIELARPAFEPGAIGLDYASGTGGSGIPLCAESKARELDLQLAFTDVMPSWFQTAHRLLSPQAGTHFFLIDLRAERPILDLFGESRFDFVVSASTIHLLPPKKLEEIFTELFGTLRPGGTLVFNTGDLESPARSEAKAALLHDIYRRTRDLIRDDEDYARILDAIEDEPALKQIHRGHQVFPDPVPQADVLAAIEKAGFVRESVEDHVIEKSRSDAEDFIRVRRLTSIAAALPTLEARRELIDRHFDAAWNQLIEAGEADAERVRTFWTFGVYRKPE